MSSVRKLASQPHFLIRYIEKFHHMVRQPGKSLPMATPGGTFLRHMKTSHSIFSREHFRHQYISIPNLDETGRPVYPFQDA